MGTLGIPVAAWDALTDGQRETVSTASMLPQLGVPAVYVDELGVDQYVWDDPRITEDQVIRVAVMLKDPSLITEPPKAAF